MAGSHELRRSNPARTATGRKVSVATPVHVAVEDLRDSIRITARATGFGPARRSRAPRLAESSPPPAHPGPISGVHPRAGSGVLGIHLSRTAHGRARHRLPQPGAGPDSRRGRRGTTGARGGGGGGTQSRAQRPDPGRQRRDAGTSDRQGIPGDPARFGRRRCDLPLRPRPPRRARRPPRGRRRAAARGRPQRPGILHRAAGPGAGLALRGLRGARACSGST